MDKTDEEYIRAALEAEENAEHERRAALFPELVAALKIAVSRLYVADMLGGADDPVVAALAKANS